MKSNNKTITKRGKIIAIIIAILLACCITVSGIMLFKPQKPSSVTNAASTTPSTVTVTSKDKTQLNAGDQFTISVTFSTTRTDWWYAMQATLVPLKSDGTVDAELCAALSLVSFRAPAQIAAQDEGDWSSPFGQYSPAVVDLFGTGDSQAGLLFMFSKGTTGEMLTSKDCKFEIVLKVDQNYSGSLNFTFGFSPTEESFVTTIPAGNASNQTDDNTTNKRLSITCDSFKVGDGGGTTQPDPVLPTLSTVAYSTTSATASDFQPLNPAGDTLDWKLSDHAVNSYVYFKVAVPTGATVSPVSPLSTTSTTNVYRGSVAYGTNTFKIKVQGTSASQEYVFTVNLLERINTISSITASPALSGFTFNSTTSTYNVTVENNVSSVTLTVTIDGSYEDLKTSGKTPANNTHTGKVYSLRYDLAEGANAITVYGVSDKDTTSKVDGTKYTININRKSDSTTTPPTTPSTDSSLGGLTITSGGKPATLSPTFRPDKTDGYTATVDDIDDITVFPTPGDGNAKTETKITPNPDGTKTVTVTVTAEDGSTTEYTVTVKEKEPTPPPVLEGDAYLSAIYVDKYNEHSGPIGYGVLINGFDPTVTEYNVYVPSDAAHPGFAACADNANITMKVNGVVVDDGMGMATYMVPLEAVGATARVEFIVSTSDDTRTYILNVTRSTQSPYLSYLAVGSYPIFDAKGQQITERNLDDSNSIRDFYVTIENADLDVNVVARANPENARVQMRNNGQLSVADLFEGKATADLTIVVGIYDNNVLISDLVTYTLHLTRKPALSDSTNARIIIDEITKSYNPVIFNDEYAANWETKFIYGTPYHVPYNVAALTIHVYPDAMGDLVAPPTYQIFYGDVLKNDNGVEDASLRLEYGLNVVFITLTSSDRSASKTIAVLVERERPYLFASPMIKEIPDFTSEYTPEVTDYAYTVGHDVTKLTVLLLKWDEKLYTCTVSDNANDLKVGLNTITICLYEKAQQGSGVSKTAASTDVPDAVRTITLSVFRENNGPSTIWLILFIIFLLLAILEFIILLLLLLRNRKETVTERVVVTHAAPAPAPVVRQQVAPVQFVAMPQPQVQYVQVPQPQPQPQPVVMEKPQQPVNVEVKITGCGESDGFYKTKK